MTSPRAGHAMPRVVVVTRPTDYESLLYRHGTHQQARFFLSTRGQSIDAIQADHELARRAVAEAERAIPFEWRRTRVGRSDLDRFLFEPGDIIIAVGQDGLVANLAKYLDGQPVIGVNPNPQRYDGVLCGHSPDRITALLRAVHDRQCAIHERTMVEARTDDGQSLLALNEVFVGQRSHQSARYRITWRDATEYHSSSGLIATTGTGATGWARSIHRQRHTHVSLPAPGDQRLAFFVREAFPSVATGTDITDGDITVKEALDITSEMNEGGVIFGDGIEVDRIDFHYGMRLSIRVARTRLCMVGALARSRGRARRRRRAAPADLPSARFISR